MNFRLIAVLLGAAVLTGCASHETTTKKFSALDRKIQQMDAVDAKIEATHTRDISSIEAKLAREIQKLEEKMAAEVKKVETEHAKDLAKTNEQLKETLRIAMGKFVFTPADTEKTVLFAINSAAISQSDQETLANLAKALTSANKNVLLEIKGYTDRKGSEYQNQILAQRRAEAVRMFLNKEGVALNRMSVAAQSNRAESTSADEAAMNRRVTISILQ